MIHVEIGDRYHLLMTKLIDRISHKLGPWLYERVFDPKMYWNYVYFRFSHSTGVAGIQSRPDETPTNCFANCNSVQIAAVLAVIVIIAIGIGVGVHFLLQRTANDASNHPSREIFFGNEYEDETSNYTYWWWTSNRIAANNVCFQYRIWGWVI